jgi:exosortase O
MSIFKLHLTASQAEALPWGVRLGTNAAILGLWLWLYRPVYDYLAIIFSREDFRTNQIVLLAVALLTGWQVWQGDFRPQFSAPPRLAYPALGLALGGSLLFLAVERFLDVNTLSASLFGLASYGLLGLWLEPHRWRQGLPAILLLVGALPFGEHMQTFIGYPVRLLTAEIVRNGLAAAGVASLGLDTILVFENGVSQVDLPCSGVKSLWTGMLFLLAATWLERRALNLRWLGIALIFAGLLLVANLLRVGILVIAGPVAGWPLVAEMLHVPLGVMGFVAACAAAVVLLRRLASPAISDPPGFAERSAALNQPGWLSPVLVLALLLMIFSYAARPQTGLAQTPPAWQFPQALVTEPMPLKPDEVAWLTRDGAESADRRRFEWQGLSGSMILITSRTWRAHHRPERCFEVYGLSIDVTQTHLVSPQFPLRLVFLSQGDAPFSAAYWFQSTAQTTDDYGARLWADLTPQPQRWVLVSILFDNATNPQSPEVQALYTALHETVATALAAPPPQSIAN